MNLNISEILTVVQLRYLGTGLEGVSEGGTYFTFYFISVYNL